MARITCKTWCRNLTSYLFVVCDLLCTVELESCRGIVVSALRRFYCRRGLLLFLFGCSLAGNQRAVFKPSQCERNRNSKSLSRTVDNGAAKVLIYAASDRMQYNSSRTQCKYLLPLSKAYKTVCNVPRSTSGRTGVSHTSFSMLTSCK